MTSWRILEGDCRDVLVSLPAQSVHTCVTSPPYFGLRDYGHDGQIGLELTPDEFVAALVGVFREVRRVLRDDGTVWLNLGDSYASTAPGTIVDPGAMTGKHIHHGAYRRGDTPRGCKPKDLLGIPWMVAFALRADGWYLRSDIIWSKPNPMPESVTDRPTKAHEYVFLLSKRATYFYDADAIREPHEALRRDSWDRRELAEANGDQIDCRVGNHPNGRNKRSVWTVATQPYAGAHFATFPPKLIEPCILAGCPERACGECGAPWERVVEVETGDHEAQLRPKRTGGMASPRSTLSLGGNGSREWAARGAKRRDCGFEPSCDHDALPVPGVVLDPFAGAGTTGVVALRHGRSFIGIELNSEYADLARWRIRDDSPLLNGHAEQVA